MSWNERQASLRNAVGLKLRHLGLLRAAWYGMLGVDYVRTYLPNRRFRRRYPHFAFPPAPLLFETANRSSYETYYEGGVTYSGFLLRIIRDFLPHGPVRVCEWGCGVGRLIRHLPAHDESQPVTAVGTDYAERSIRWCQRHIPNATFTVNDINPPLPFADDEFDFLYSNSVYTHLSAELQCEWFRENLRVVRPGGLVLFTMHGDSYGDRLTAQERYEYGRTGLVERSRVEEGSPWFTSYNSPEWVERQLLDGLDTVRRETFDDPSRPTQDIWVVRSP